MCFRTVAINIKIDLSSYKNLDERNMANNNSSVHQKSLWKIKDSYKHRVVRANTKNLI